MATRLIANTASELLPQNGNRQSLIIQNEDASIDCFLKFERPGSLSVSTTDHDHRISAGGNITLNKDTDGLAQVQERITIVAASGTPRISFFETESIKR